MKDGTMAIETSLSNTLIQWPFLSDISLIWALSSIFEPEPPPAGGDAAAEAAVEAVAQTLSKSVEKAWLYLNVVLHNSQLLLPVLDLVRGPSCNTSPGSAA